MSEPAAGGDARPAHHRPGGGFRNPPGSPQQDATTRDFVKFLAVDTRGGQCGRCCPVWSLRSRPI